MYADWLVPDWPAPSCVRAIFSTRHGGCSALPYDSMNLGDHVGDSQVHVQANRALLQRATGTRAVFMQQVHGNAVQMLDEATPDGLVADACFTTKKQLACTVMVADCLPVLLASSDGSWVAAAHAGWRGLAGGEETQNSTDESVVESVFKSFSATATQLPRSVAPKLIAWLGPCIGPSAFEVGAEVKRAFEASQRGAGDFFEPAGDGKFLADLAGLARQRLQALGITQIFGNDASASWCTVGNPVKYFSHRRDAGALGNGFGTTGRMAACIWLATQDERAY